MIRRACDAYSPLLLINDTYVTVTFHILLCYSSRLAHAAVTINNTYTYDTLREFKNPGAHNACCLIWEARLDHWGGSHVRIVVIWSGGVVCRVGSVGSRASCDM